MSRPLLVAAVLLACALAALRLSVCSADLPYVLDPDEAVLVEPALTVAGGTLAPQRLMTHPASVALQAIALADRALYLEGARRGAWQSWDEFRMRLRRAPAILMLIARFVCALAGVWVSAALMLVLHRAGLPVAGCLVAGGLHALSGLYLEYSHHVRPDFLQSLMILGALYHALGVLERGRTRDYVLAGGFCGLATACKYPSFVTFALVPVAHLLAGRTADGPPGEPRRRATMLVLAGSGAALLLSGLTWTYVWPEVPPFDRFPPEWRDGDVFIRKAMRTGGIGLLALSLALLARSRLSPRILGLLWDRRPYLAALAAGGAFLAFVPDYLIRFPWALENFVYAAKSYHPRAAATPGIGNVVYYVTGPLAADLGLTAVLLAAATLLAAIARGSARARLVAVAPAMYAALLTAGRMRFERYAVPLSPWVAAGAAVALTALAGRTPYPRAALLALFVAVAAQPAVNLAHRLERFGRPDTRVTATRWIEANAPRGSRIVMEERALLLERGDLTVGEVFCFGQRPDALDVPADFHVTSDENHGEPEWEPVYEKLARMKTPVVTFSEKSGGRGPTVTIWK